MNPEIEADCGNLREHVGHTIKIIKYACDGYIVGCTDKNCPDRDEMPSYEEYALMEVYPPADTDKDGYNSLYQHDKYWHPIIKKHYRHRITIRIGAGNTVELFCERCSESIIMVK